MRLACESETSGEPRLPLLAGCLPPVLHEGAAPPADFVQAGIHVIQHLAASKSSFAGLGWMHQPHHAAPSLTVPHTYIRLLGDTWARAGVGEDQSSTNVPKGWARLFDDIKNAEPFINTAHPMEFGTEVVMMTPVANADAIALDANGQQMRKRSRMQGFSFRRAMIVISTDRIINQGGHLDVGDVIYLDDWAFVHVAPISAPTPAPAPAPCPTSWTDARRRSAASSATPAGAPASAVRHRRSLSPPGKKKASGKAFY